MAKTGILPPKKSGTKQTPAEVVIGEFGIRPLARQLNIEPSTILRWRESGIVPAKHHVKLIQISGDEITAEDLVFGRK